MKRFAGTGALAAIVVPLIAFAADPCEQFVSATNRSTHPDGYKLLDDRCEGLLYQPTSAGDGLFLVSLLAGNVSPQNNPKIEVSFARPGAGTVHIQAMPRISEVLYRMDVETDKNQYAWPATIPRANALAIADLGIMASIAVSGRPTPVFLPVAVKANAPEDWPKTAILQSKAPMSRVMVKLRAAKYGGGWGSNMQLDGGVSLIDSNTAKVSLTQEQLWPSDGGSFEANTFEVTLVAPTSTGNSASSTTFLMYARKPTP